MSSTDETLFSDFLAGSRAESEATLNAASQIEAGDAELSAPVGIGKTFQRGFRAGVAGLDTDAQYFGALANTLMGDEEGAKERVKRARLAETEASNALAGMQTFEEFLDEPTVGGFLDQAILSVGQITPMAATAIGTSFAGALVGASGRLAANAATRATTKKLTQDVVDKQARGELLDPDEKAILDIGYGLTQSAKTGALGGAFLQEYPMMAGGSFGEFDEAGVDLDADRAFQAAALGVPLAAVGVAGEALIVKSLANLATKKAKKTGTSRLKEYASNILKEGAFGGATEAGTEIVQEGAMVAQRMAVDPEYDAAQAQLRLGQAAFAGFFGGKALSGTGAAVAGIPQVLRDTTERAKEFIDNAYDANVAGQVDEEVELANIEEQFELGLEDTTETPPQTPDTPVLPDAPTSPDAAAAPDAPTTPDSPTTPDTGPREMQLAEELAAAMDTSPEQNPLNIDADDTGSLPFDPEGPFSDINPEEDRGREPRAVASYQPLQDRFKEQTLNDAEYNRRFNLLNQLYEQRGYTENDGTSVLEKFRGSLSASNLKVLAGLITKNSDIATYFPEFQTIDGEQRVVIMEYPTEQGRRRARRQTIDPETGQEVDTNAAELSASAINTAERGAGNPDLPKFRVIRQGRAFGDLEGEANNQNVELGFLANAGISVNTADQATLIGEGLSRAQQLKLGFLRMFGDIIGSGRTLSFEGTDVDIQALAAEAATNVDADGRYNGTNPILQTEVTSEGYSDSLGNLLLTPDPRTNKERTAGVNQEQRVNEQLARADFDEDIGSIRQKYRDEFVRRREEMRAEGRSERDIKLMGANLKSRMATEIAAFTEFDPADIEDTAQDLDPINNPEDRAEQEFRQEGGLDQEDADLYSPAREQDPNKAVKSEKINRRFNARRARLRGSLQGPALERQLALNELNRKAELEKLEAQPAERTKARPSRILLEMQPMPGDRMPGSSLRASDARTLGGASLNPAGPEMGPNRRAVNRQARRVKRKTAPTVTLNGELGTLTSRIANKAMSLFKFSKPIHVFTLSELKANFQSYTSGEGKYAPVGEFLSETIARMDENQDGVRVPGRMVTTGDAHIIVINDTDVQSGTINDAAVGTVLAHEIGHILFKEEMQSLLDKPRGKMLFEAFQRHVEEMGGEVPSQYADADELMSLGFEEFYADQVAVFLLDESAKADTGAKAYFKQIANKLKEFMKAVSQILGGRITQATTTNAQVGVPFRAKQEGETDAAYNEAKTAYDNQPFVQTYFDQVVAEHKRKTRELVDEYDEVGWATQHAAREIAIDIQKEIKDRAPGLLDSYKSVTEKILQSGSYKWLSRMLSSVDGWLREQGPEGIAIAQFFYAKSSSKERIGFHEAKGRKNREFNNRLAAIFDLNIKAEENAWEAPEVKNSLELAQNEDVSDADLQRRADAGDTVAANALEVRGLFSDIFDNYITNPKTGRPWFAIQKRQNYAPRMWNFIAIQENPEAFRTLLLKAGISPQRIDAILSYVDENETSEDIRLGETEEDAQLRRELEELSYQAERLAERRGISIERAAEIIKQAKEKARLSPGMDAALSRELAKVSTAAAREAGFMQPAGMAMIQYFHQLTRKVEYERRGGYARIKSLIDAAPEDIRHHLDDAVLAQLGKKGQGMSGGWRLFNSIAAVHTALTTLLFTVFASVTDLAGIGVRLKEYDNIKAFYKEVFSGFKESFTGVGERVQFAQDVGVITMEAMDNMFIATGELDFANTWARKTMAGFFKYTGLNWYTRATRIMAAGAGRMFLIRTATKKNFGAREARYLEELGLTREEVLAAYDADTDALNINNNEKIREAVVRFAEESIIRPNPAQRPSWASSPYFTAIWQLKSYFYAYGKTVLGGMGREVKNRYSEDGNFQGGAMLLLMAAGMMLPLTALGLELREYMKWTIQFLLPGIDATDRVFRSDYMDTGEYLFEVGIDRSGILGPFTLALTAIESLKWEGPIGPVIANIPFADAIDDVFIDGDYMRTVPVLNNVQ